MDKLAVGIDIGGTNIKAGLVNKNGEIITFKKSPTQAKEGFKHTFEIVKSMAHGLIEEAGIQNICGIGCATAGQVDHIEGKVVYATGNIPGLTGFEMKRELEEEFGLPAAVENDVNAVALGEHWVGAAKDFDDFVCLTLGTGIGGAIFRNGGIDHGADGIAGELGHIIIKFDGIPCNCGNTGCFEKYASVSALIKNFSEHIENGEKSIVLDEIQGDLSKLNGEMIFKARANGDALAELIINEYINYAAIGITSIVHTLNPRAVVIGGGITRVGDELMKPLIEKIRKKALPKFTENLIITGAKLGDNAGLCGIVRELFN